MGYVCIERERGERREKKKEIDAVLNPRSKSCMALYNKHVNGIRRFSQKLQSQLYSIVHDKLYSIPAFP